MALKGKLAILISCFLFKKVLLECIPEPCDRTTYCVDGDYTPHPTDCSLYYRCVHGVWQLNAPCPGNDLFDPEICVCNSQGSVRCLDPCPTTPPPPTLAPEPCPDVPVPCEEGRRYPDVSACEFYFQCTGGTLEHKFCELGGVGFTCVSGRPCVFDIPQENCVDLLYVSPGFSCEERCPGPTTMVTETSTHAPTSPKADTTEQATGLQTTEATIDHTAKGSDRTTVSDAIDTTNVPDAEDTTFSEGTKTTANLEDTTPGESGLTSTEIAIIIAVAVTAVIAILLCLLFLTWRYLKKHKQVHHQDTKRPHDTEINWE